MRSTASVRIWLILIQDRLGRPEAPLSSVRGEAGSGFLAREGHGDHGSGSFVEDVMAEDKDGSEAGPLASPTGWRSAQRISPLPGCPDELLVDPVESDLEQGHVKRSP